jgi:glutathione S-transferase
MRLFDFSRAPNPRRVRMFLAEKGMEIPRVPVNLYRMEQLSSEFLAINPGGTVPVLELDDGTRLTECLAICHYLESVQPEPRLFGQGAKGEALVLMWNNIVEAEGIPSAAEVLRNLSPGFRDRVFPGTVDYPQLPALVQRGAIRTQQFFDRMQARLAESPFLAGEAFSFADITLLATVDFAKWVEIDATHDRPAVARWYASVKSRPSVGA